MLRRTFCILLVLHSVAIAQAQDAQVIVDHRDNRGASKSFAFARVPSPAADDAATDARFIPVDGSGDGNSMDLAVLHDGKLPDDRDQPSANFFFAAGTDGGRFVLDLHKAIDVDSVNSYSWHPSDRAPQVYVLWGSDGTDPKFSRRPKRDVDPTSAGWVRIAAVDTRPASGNPGGQYGVSVRREGATLGQFRYLLFDVSRTEDRDAFGNTFYSEIDVIDHAAAKAPAATPGVIEVAIDGGRAHATIDTTGSPDLAQWAIDTLVPMIQTWYPKLVEALPGEGFTAPQSLHITISDETGGIAATGGRSGAEIACNGRWFRQHRDDEAVGAVLHELVHVVQHYGRGRQRAPGWITEGIADWLRWCVFEPESHGADIDTRDALEKARPDAGYRVSANFLDHVVHKHDKDLIAALNAACRSGDYDESIWKRRTGYTLAELADAWKAELTAQIAEMESANTLTDEESAAGWRLLFDGKSFAGWHNFKSRRVRDGWQVEKGAMVCADPHRAGDLVTADQFAWFELTLDYAIEPGGNSGIMFHVTDEGGAPWATGPEFQLEDNAKAADPQRCGWLYALYQPPEDPKTGKPLDATRPAGEWNHVRLLIAPDRCEHEINGVTYFSYQLDSEDFAARIARSKFASMPGFAKSKSGRIALQGDHGRIRFRNIKLRVIDG